jgi:hypothetical protein
MGGVIASTPESFPLISIHREKIRPGKYRVGKVLRIGQRSLRLLSVSPEAEWEEEESFQLKDITLVEFGGAYESLLVRMAPPVGT